MKSTHDRAGPSQIGHRGVEPDFALLGDLQTSVSWMNVFYLGSA
jgi:hypothetical protein